MERKIKDIENGTVIDHVAAGASFKVLDALGVKKQTVWIAMNVESSRLGTKDLIKIENKFLSPDDMKKVAKIAPDATVNTIKNFKIVDKKQVK